MTMIDSKPDSSNDLLARVDDFKSGRISATERVENALSKIARVDPTINAFHDLLAEEARSTAKELDATRERGDDLGPLAGSIIAIKDNICMNVGRTTCSSRMLEEYRSPFDATVIERLRAAGAILLGKTNLDEFAMGSSSERCAWGPVRNPHATDRVPG